MPHTSHTTRIRKQPNPYPNSFPVRTHPSPALGIPVRTSRPFVYPEQVQDTPRRTPQRRRITLVLPLIAAGHESSLAPFRLTYPRCSPGAPLHTIHGASFRELCFATLQVYISIPFGGSLSVLGTEVPFPSNPPRTPPPEPFRPEGLLGFWMSVLHHSPVSTLSSRPSCALTRQRHTTHDGTLSPPADTLGAVHPPQPSSGTGHALYLLSPRSGSRPAPCLHTLPPMPCPLRRPRQSPSYP